MLFKFIKKTLEGFGYKLIEKNLIKNDRLISDSSYLKLDKILEHFFEKGEINFIIQIGANDGNRFDIINKFIKKYSPKVVFLEPIISNFNELKKNYSNQKNLIFENLAISVDNKITHLFKVKDDKLYIYDDHVIGITSFNFKHLIKHGIKKNHIIKEEVKTISIIKLIEKHSIKNFDLLLIDTEGYDGEIVIDFLNKSNIRPIIIFEYVHIKNNILNNSLDLLTNKNYFFFKIDENIICYPNEREAQIKFA